MSNKKEEQTNSLDKIVQIFLENRPYVKDVSKNNELEISFGTKGIS